MRIALVHPVGTLWLAGDPAVAERVHPSAGGLRINGQTATQTDNFIRGTAARHTDRGNLRTTISFETSRIFATPAEAEVFSGMYDAVSPRAGTLVLCSPSAGAEVILNFAGCVVQPPRREVRGCSVLLAYEVLAGLPTEVVPIAQISGVTLGGASTLLDAGLYNGKKSYTHDGSAVATALTGDPFTALYWTGTVWRLRDRPLGAVYKTWESSSTVTDPADIPPGVWSIGNGNAWIGVYPATGTPAFVYTFSGAIP